MRAIVVHHQMNIQRGGNTFLEMIQEGQQFLVTMPRFALPDDRAVGDIERREQRGRAMSKVIMGDTLDITEPHRQNRLTAFQCLDLAFFVNAQYQGIIGWIQVQTDNIAHLVDEEGIGREFERAAAIGLDPKQREIPMNGTFRGRGLPCKRTPCSNGSRSPVARSAPFASSVQPHRHHMCADDGPAADHTIRQSRWRYTGDTHL